MMQVSVEHLQQPMRLPSDLEPAREHLAAMRQHQLAGARQTASMTRDHRLGIVRPLMPPEFVPSRLRRITSWAGDVPLALRAWHSTVGGVNLVGSHSELAPPGVECDPLFVAPLNCVWEGCEAWQEDRADDKERHPFRCRFRLRAA